MFAIIVTFHLEKHSSWLENCIQFFLMLLMELLIGDTYTSSKINSHGNAHIFKVFLEYFVHNASLFYKAVTSSLIV